MKSDAKEEEYTFNLTTGDVAYSSNTETRLTTNPYLDASQLRQYRFDLEYLLREIRDATENINALGDAIAHLSAVRQEVRGETPPAQDNHKLYFDFFPHFYDMEFNWRNASDYPDTITVSTYGKRDGQRHSNGPDDSIPTKRWPCGGKADT